MINNLTEEQLNRVITIHDIRRLNHCAKGTRNFFKSRNPADFKKLCTEGLTVREILAFEDGLADRIVQGVLNGR